jgi:hypothetical protein
MGIKELRQVFGLDARKPRAAQITLIIGNVRITGVSFLKMGDSGGWRLWRSSVGRRKGFFDMGSERARCKVCFAGKPLHGLRFVEAAIVTALLMMSIGPVANAQAAPGPAQAARAPAPAGQSPATPAPAMDIVGIWQGTLHIPQANRDLRIENKISRDDKGNLKVVDYSIDQGGQPLVANKASFDGGVLTFSIDRIGGKYEGKMSPDGKTITGTWTQGPNPLALNLDRTTEEAAWPIPEPPKPMAADANPKFDVVTVVPLRYSYRHWNTWFAFTPCSRATRAIEAPGTNVASTIRRFSSGVLRNRFREAATDSTATVSLTRSSWGRSGHLSIR